MLMFEADDEIYPWVWRYQETGMWQYRECGEVSTVVPIQNGVMHPR
jgi:hypothetical protein